MDNTLDELKNFSDHIFSKLSNIGYNKLNDSEKIFVCVWSFAGEVENGGFEQWLYNTSGDWAKDTSQSFIAIKATTTAALIENALKLFPNTPPEDMNERRKIMGSLPEETSGEWDNFNKLFNNTGENIDDLLLSYSKQFITL